MFEDRSHKRTFFSAPQSVASLVAAFAEPALAIATYLITCEIFNGRITRPDIVLCLLVLTLTFPGRDRFREEPLNAATDVALSWVMLLAILALFGYATGSLHMFSKKVAFTWAALVPLLQIAAMVIGRSIIRHRVARSDLSLKAVVVGAGPLGVKVARALEDDRERGVKFAGWFDDRADDRSDKEAMEHIRGRLDDLPSFILANGIKEVYITLPLGSQPRIAKLLESIQATTASIYFVPDVFGISIIQGRLQDINGIPAVGICETPFTGINELIKRLSDIVIASVILLLISPLLMLIAAGVKLSSPGPVIFKQRRNGLDGSEITVFKFRSMRTMDDGGFIKQATRADPRITPFGAFLRRTSLDELPQFFNVLQGTMSIVGPRPHAVAHNEQYRRIIKAYMVRHKVKPGITGWAQVNGFRGETDTIDKMQARVEYDLEYLRNWSLLLDLQIIVRTIRLLFSDRHAY